MPGLYDNIHGVAFFSGTPVTAQQFTFAAVDGVERYIAGWVGNENQVALDYAPMLGGVPSAPPAELGWGVGRFQKTHHSDYHFRFWINPTSYTLRDPELGALFTFTVWNTFPSPPQNAIVDIVYNSIEGVDFTVAPGYEINSFQLDTWAFSVNEDAPSSMSGSVTFEFEQGDFSLGLIIERDTTMPLPPDFPWEETYRWETNILVSENGKEQRISLAGSPEVTHSVTFTAIDNDETVDLVGSLLTVARNAPAIPLYQYATSLRADVSVGDLTIETNAQRGDIRAGDGIVIRARGGLSEPAKVASVSGTTVTLNGPLQNAFKKGAFVIPTYELTVDPSQSMQRARVHEGKLTFVGRPRRRRTPFLSAQNTVSLRTLEGLPVLDKRPLGNDKQTWSFDSGRRFAEFGRVIAVKDPWGVSRVEMPVSYQIDSFFTPTELAYWRTFLDHCRGATKAFLLPTYRQDLQVAVAPVEGGGMITVAGNQVSNTYLNTGQLKGLRIVTQAGEHFCWITAADVVDETKETISFSPALPLGLEWTNVLEIGMIFLARLKSDEVTIQHYPQHSILSMAVRTITA